jgi:D-arginine dehydrogenase
VNPGDQIAVDVAVVGGGIAGVSVAGELARTAGLRVAVLEQEGQLAYHTSGRSAAAFLESYGSREIIQLTRASRPLFDAVAAGGTTLLTPRPVLWVAGAGNVKVLEQLLSAAPVLRPVEEADVRTLCRAIRPGWVLAAAVEDGAQDLDVAGLLEHYRRLAATNGATILTRAPVHEGWQNGDWLLRTGAGDVRARVVVNAAGAWADDLARRCGVAPVGLTPLRRTVAIASCGEAERTWPLVVDVAETFYFRPEGDGLLVSPADVTPSEPTDARATIEDVALALDRVNAATTLDLRHVRTSWAGLRTFAPDHNPVVGFDAGQPGFFWLAGQGGYGMQTAPAMAQLAAALIRGGDVPAPVAMGVDPSRLSPARFLDSPLTPHPPADLGHSAPS